MDKKSKYLLILFVLIALISAVATYYKYVHLQDYDIYFSEMDEFDWEL